jgi:hypothetical protein
MLKKPLLGLIVSMAMLTGLPALSRATTVERLTLEDLTRRSQSIVQGVVRGSRTYWAPDRKLIFTSTTIEVTEAIKGQSPRIVEVTTVGGRIGDTVLHVGGMPAFTQGENTIVFVERSSGYLTVLGLGQGKFTVSNGEVANSPSELAFPDGRPARTTRMPVQTFKSEIRSIVDRAR